MSGRAVRGDVVSNSMTVNINASLVLAFRGLTLLATAPCID
jgi:hypothetical protein